jgi:hypothetical protein
VLLTLEELQDLKDKTANATMKSTNAIRDQIAVTEMLCPDTQRRLLAASVISIFITVRASGAEGAVQPADVELKGTDLGIIAEAVVSVVYAAEAVDVIPTITITSAAADAQVP